MFAKETQNKRPYRKNYLKSKITKNPKKIQNGNNNTKILWKQ